jgi:hypothetical protein
MAKVSSVEVDGVTDVSSNKPLWLRIVGSHTLQQPLVCSLGYFKVQLVHSRFSIKGSYRQTCLPSRHFQVAGGELCKY